MHLRRNLLLAGLLLLPAQALLAADPVPGPERWEKTITELEKLDKTEKHPDDAILFVGSSSIRLWEDIATDMAPYATIRRGYGGAKFSDLEYYAKRLIHPHTFQALVIFVANDVSGGPNDKSPAEVVALLQSILKTVREKHATVPVFIIEITPTGRRFAAWQKIHAVNNAMAEVCSDTPNVHWIGTATHYLTDDGQPRDELFREDRLHQNAAGYDLWASLIKARLDTVLKKH